MFTGAHGASASRQIPRESNDRIEDDGDGQRQDDRSRTLRQPIACFVQADLVDPSGRADRWLDRARLSPPIDRASLPARHRSIRIPTGIPCSYASEMTDLLARTDAPVRALFERIAGPAAAAPADLTAIGAALVELANDVDYLAPWIARLGDRSGALAIHAPERGPRLMLVHRREGQMGAIHDHATWVAISPITGLETHRRYRIVGEGPAARPEIAEARALRAVRCRDPAPARGHPRPRPPGRPRRPGLRPDHDRRRSDGGSGAMNGTSPPDGTGSSSPATAAAGLPASRCRSAARRDDRLALWSRSWT